MGRNGWLAIRGDILFLCWNTKLGYLLYREKQVYRLRSSPNIPKPIEIFVELLPSPYLISIQLTRTASQSSRRLLRRDIPLRLRHHLITDEKLPHRRAPQ